MDIPESLHRRLCDLTDQSTEAEETLDRQVFFHPSIHTASQSQNPASLQDPALQDLLPAFRQGGLALCRALNFFMQNTECQVAAAFPILRFQAGYGSLRHDVVDYELREGKIPLTENPSSGNSVHSTEHLWPLLHRTEEERWADALFHARHSAVRRHYIYRLCLTPPDSVAIDPWEASRAW